MASSLDVGTARTASDSACAPSAAATDLVRINTESTDGLFVAVQEVIFVSKKLLGALMA